MTLFLCFLVFCIAFVANADPKVRITRGVSPREHQRYLQSLTTGVFQCYDGRVTITADQVNDDYCDCPDGSDEPGTAACSTSIGFWCPNAGFRPQRISNSRIGDGICDCCDGSDEAGLAHNQCPDTCAEEATRLAQEEAAKRDRIQRAKSVRDAAIAKGKEAQQARRQKLAELPSQIEAAERQIQELGATLQQEEELEKQERADKEQKSHVVYWQALGLKDLPLESLRHILVELSLAKHEESGEALMDSVKAVMGAEHEIEDTSVLAAALDINQDDTPAKKALAAAEAELATAEAQAKEVVEDSLQAGNAEEAVQAKKQIVEATLAAMAEERRQLEKERRDNLLQAISIEKISILQIEDIIWGVVSATKQFLKLAELTKENGGGDANALLPEEVSTYKRQETEAVRQSLETAKTQKEQLEKEQKETQDEDRLDYGPDLEYYVLKGQCFSSKAGEHSYSFCPFGTSKQETRSLGQWSGWHKQTEWHSQYRMMKFTGGDRFGCPADRELTVNIDCGDVAEITKIEEPSMCKYSMNFVCPEACSEESAS